MFPLIPYKHFTINTNLSMENVVKSVADSISKPPSSLSGSSSRKGFEGSVSRDRFTISRVFHGRNPLLPVLNGRFSKIKSGTRIDVYITPNPILIILLIIFLPTFGSPFLTTAMTAIKDFFSSGGDVSTTLLESMGTLVFFYLLIFFLFGFEAQKAEQFIRMVYEKHEQFSSSTKTTRQSVQHIAFAIGGLAFIAGLIISWLSFGR